MQALMLGCTLIGERVFDVDRAIDYLATREDGHRFYADDAWPVLLSEI